MRILHVFDHSVPLHSGYSFRSKSIIEQQRKVGWETEHVTSSKHGDIENNEEIIDGLHFYRTSNTKLFFNQFPLLDQYAVVRSLKKRLGGVLVEYKPDLIQVHSPCLNGLAVLNAARKHKIPIIYEVRAFWEDAAVNHGTTNEGSLRYRLTRLLETYVLNKVDAVTTICAGLKNDMVERGIPENKITIIPNAVDVESFIPQTVPDPRLQKQLKLQGCIVLGFIGSFYSYEGIDLLIQALPIIKKSGINAKILLVGGGPQENRLRALSDELNITNDVIFTGRVPHETVEQYYSLVDVLAYPRYSMRLTELVTPLKPLEAMAQEKLFVASDVGGHRELIEDGVTGTLFEAGSVSALATALIDLLSDKQNWSTRKKAGKCYVEKERTWRISVFNYKKVYEDLLSDQS